MTHDATLPLPPSPPADGHPQLYVINADSAFLETIAALLADSRAQVTLEQLRPNVEISLDNLRSAHPDLLILDIVPYQRDAPALLQRIAADAELARLPVMLASTSPGVAERLAETYPAIVRDILPKPFDLDVFFAKLNRLVAGINAH
ncbi:MAG: two-component system response regulator [Ktedonobacterales bacterium]